MVLETVKQPIDEKRLLVILAKKPCACGRDSCVDRQTIISRKRGFDEEVYAEVLKCECQCDVCGDIHTATLLTPKIRLES